MHATLPAVEFYYDEIDDDVLVLVADGGLNSATAEEFLQSIQKLVDAGLPKIIVDCEKLEHISSFGLSVLIRLPHNLKRHGGNVKVCNVPGMVVQVLTLTRLNRVLEIYPDVNKARAAFKALSDV